MKPSLRTNIETCKVFLFQLGYGKTGMFFQMILQISHQVLKTKTKAIALVMQVGYLQQLQTLKPCTERNTLNISRKQKQKLNLIYQSKRSSIVFQLKILHAVMVILRTVLLLQELSLVFHLKASILHTKQMMTTPANDFEKEMQT